MKRDAILMYSIICISIAGTLFVAFSLSVFSNLTNSIFISISGIIYLIGVIILNNHALNFLKEYSIAKKDPRIISFDADLSNQLFERYPVNWALMKELKESNESYLASAYVSISSISSILVTLGFLGTIAGLILSFSGIKDVISSIENKNEIISGMYNTLSGVDIAFYTTLFGAFLGGISLKLCLIFLARMGQNVISIFRRNALNKALDHDNHLETKRLNEELEFLLKNMKSLNNQIETISNSIQANRLQLVLSGLETNFELTRKAIEIYKDGAQKG